MKNLKARICSGAMAGVLALSLAVPAFAAGNTPMNTQTEITATYQKVDIKVIVPQTGTALINPYGLDLKVKDAANNEVTISGQKIVTAPMSLKNHCDEPEGWRNCDWGHQRDFRYALFH